MSSGGATLQGSFSGETGTISEVGFYYGTTNDPSTKVVATGTSSPFTKALTGLTSNTTYHYKAYVIEGGEERTGSVQSFKTKAVATSTVTTGEATNITSSSAQLNASFSGATGTIYKHGFRYKAGTDDWTEVELDSTTGTSGSFSTTISSLSANTLYQFQAYVGEWNENTGVSGAVEYRYGSTLTFTTQPQSQPTTTGWLELPAYTTSAMAGTTTSSLSDLYRVTHKATMGGKVQRNYTCLYDPEMYASYWVAYPLCSSHLGSGKKDTFAYDPDVPQAKQTNLTNGAYGVNIATTNYPSNLYSRGHQIPNADRNGVSAMQDQTYYITNVTPQIQNGFNSPLWSDIETAVRDQTSKCDTVYVVTGAAFRKKGGSETITKITNTRDNKQIPVPNYYWKVVLKVKRSGGSIVSASAIGFWVEHADLKGHSYTEYTTSVSQIQTWTGFDFFPNLPDDLETAAEQNSSWSTFNSTSNISSVGNLNWGTL